MLDQNNLDEILHALDRQIEVHGGSPISLVVCGGTVDRNDYHVDDLFKLKPTQQEIEDAARWVLTQDVSIGFKTILIDFLRKHGYEDISERI